MATADGASWQEYPSPVVAELEKNGPAIPVQSELYGELHATATPLDLMAPDINISGYSYEGRYELPTSWLRKKIMHVERFYLMNIVYYCTASD
jgi:hypothetical protein